MRLQIALGALLSLAGCGEQYGVDTGEGPMQPGIYEATQPDGTVTRMVFKKDGDYADMADNVPKPIDQGKWRRQDGKLCLKSDVSKTESCFPEKAEGDDGSFTMTLGDVVGRFRPIALSP